MKILDRYILKAFFTNYLIALLVMVGLYVTLDLFVNLDEFTGFKDATLSRTLLRVMDYYGHNLFLYFAQLAGLITLFAACFTLGRFHRMNEFTAILSSGTSMYRVAAPLMVAALFMNMLWLYDQEVLVPHFADKLARKHAEVGAKSTLPVWLLPDRDGALVSATAFSARLGEMRGVHVILRDAQSRMSEAIKADRAVWDAERQVWHLDNGLRLRFRAGLKIEEDGTAEALQAAVEEQTAGLRGEPVQEYVSDLSPKEVRLQQAQSWTQFLSLGQINELQGRYAAISAGEFVRAKHVRLTTIPLNMILLCLGIPFYLNRERPTIIVIGGKSLLACGLCFVLTFFCQNIDVQALGLHPALPAWIPVMLFAPAAVLLMESIKT